MSHVANTTDKSGAPRPVLIMAGALMLFTAGVAGLAKHNHNDHVVLPPSSAVTVRDLAFKDMPDGGVSVSDAVTGRLVELFRPTTGGFLRGVMRGLVRDHRKVDNATGYPFRLTRWSDGRLTLEDPGTRESFELESFGSTNEQVFANFLSGSGSSTVAAATSSIDVERR